MYLEQLNQHILNIIGVVGVVTFVTCVIYLIFSYRASRTFKKMKQEEFNQLTILNTTISGTESETIASITSSFDKENVHAEATMADLSSPASGNDCTLVDSPLASGDDCTLVDSSSYSNVDEHTLADSSPSSNGKEHTLPDSKSNIASSIIDAIGNFPNKLKEEYTPIGRLGSGGQGSIFLARKNNTGNLWVVKHIPWTSLEAYEEFEAAHGDFKKEQELTSGRKKVVAHTQTEFDFLHNFNHHNLPSIIDIFTDETGLFLVESYVEGKEMSQIIKEVGRVNGFVLLEWADQLTQVLNYMHHMQPEPFYHFDLKPSNIMITSHNNITLIDFGISSKKTYAHALKGGTPSYAAPEQLLRMKTERNESIIDGIITKRFKALPESSSSWNSDARTDIYCLGMILFEAATGVRPNKDNMDELQKHLSKEFCDIIYKCLAVNPQNRYQTVDEIISDIQKQKNQKAKIDTRLFIRRSVMVAACIAFFISVGGFVSSDRLGRLYAEAVVYVTPNSIVVSVGQDTDVRVRRILPNGSERYLNVSNVTWNIVANDVAQIDGTRLRGISVGETYVTGTYGNINNLVALSVRVVPPVQRDVEILQRFRSGNSVSLFAGNEMRESIDGENMNFVAVQSITATSNGVIYVADYHFLRRIENGIAETVYIDPFFIVPAMVYAYDQDLFFVTEYWQDFDDRFVYSIIRRSENGMHELYHGDASATRIHDMAVSNGLVYIIEYHIFSDTTFLRTININNPMDIQNLAVVSNNTRSLAVVGNVVYLVDASTGELLRYYNGEITTIAGTPETMGIIDGTLPNFFMPLTVRHHAGNLYVWDFNVLRRVYMENGIVREVISLAGLAGFLPEHGFYTESSEYTFSHLPTATGIAENVAFHNDYRVDFVHVDGGVLISCPRRGVIMLLELIN